MDSSGVGIKIYDDEKKIGIYTQNAKDLSKENKKYLLDDNDDLIYDIYARCDYEFLINANSPEELKLAYVLAMYISENTDMILVNLDTCILMTCDNLKILSNDELDKFVEEYKIRLEYFPEIAKWNEYSAKAFNYSTLFWIILISISVLAIIVILLLIFAYSITNYFILTLPFILIGLIYGFVFIRDYCKIIKARKEIRILRFKYQTDICKLYGDRTPKFPSGKKKNTKQLIINIMGILIVPGMITGIVLIVFNKYVLGVLAILLPWIILICIKLFITDRNEEELKKKIYLWLDDCFKEQIADEVIALNFNLCEKKNNNWSIELVGCCKFDMSNSMWTINDTYQLNCEIFNFNLNRAWEEIEVLLSEIIMKYFYDTNKQELLNSYKAITIGFADGAIKRIYLNRDEK